MSASTPWKHLLILREPKFPKTSFWRWTCSACNTMNDEPELGSHGICQRCRKERVLDDKILWINYIAMPRREKAPAAASGSEEKKENTAGRGGRVG